MGESKEYYKVLSEAYEMELSKLLKPSIDTITVIGVIVSMMIEVEAYGAKNGKTDRYKTSKERLRILFEYADDNNTLVNRNNILRLKLKNSHSREHYLRIELEELKTKLKEINDFEEG
ncbi:hypothetical protein [Pedobacter cryoconitis]|uniref:Uncharacterized protein n=1 Tax=Pedobacter cryoconitis TaxID=188932 RepID=A0A327SJK6_9SPHI|nr:hypothetical protein [Pedobacter cryoconitis]RAJ28908.1 hypothetical protein LY11_03182 [Pedobacter cryoconitis]